MERPIAEDPRSGLRLVADASDPPRYYIQVRRRRELIAIGAERQARSHFTALVRKRSATASDPPPRNGAGQGARR